MDPSEAQARAIIAAALIARGAVEVPAVPLTDDDRGNAASFRLQELTDYIYRLVTMEPRDPAARQG